jgi:hypothetical protein
MDLAPVLLTFKVGLDALLVTVNLTVALAPVTKLNPAIDTTLAAVPAAVSHTP